MYSRLVFLLLTALASFSCNRYVADFVPTIDYRGVKVKSVEPQINLSTQQVQAEINLQLSFRYHNPYKRALRIPEHSFGVYMKNAGLTQGRELAHLAGGKGSFRVPAEGDTVVQYLLRLDLDPLGQMKDFLGWDNYYEFRSVVRVDLKEYLPGGALRQALGQVMGNTVREIPISFGDSIRLPLPPVIKPSLNTQAQVVWVGEMEKLDLKPLRDGMNPFVSLITNTQVAVYSPTLQNPFRTVQVNFADHMVSLLTPVVPSADNSWNSFKSNWTTFKNQPSIEYPGPRVTGLQIKVPFVIHNPNHFPIECPEMEMEARLNSSYTPLSMEIDPGSSKIISPLQEKRVNCTWQMNWNNTFTLPGLFSGQALPNNPTFAGNVNVDIGYGMIRVPFSVTAPLKLGGD